MQAPEFPKVDFRVLGIVLMLGFLALSFFVTTRKEDSKPPEIKVCAAPSVSEDLALLQQRMNMCEKMCFQLVEEFDATTNRCKCFKE
jgi:hypothetical protein